MSLKRMMTKMAVAMIAAKGAQAFQQAGGLQGIRDKLNQQGRGSDVGGMQGRLGGTRASSAGGLGNLLDSLGIGGATGGHEQGMRGQISDSAGVGEILGGLAGMSGDRERATGLLARTRADAVDDEREAGLAIRAMIQAARADGGIDAEERQALMEILDDADPSDQRFIDQAMEEDVDAAALARDVPKGAELEVYSAALMAITPDNRAEAEFLDALAKGLGLGEARVNEVHDAMGKERLY